MPATPSLLVQVLGGLPVLPTLLYTAPVNSVAIIDALTVVNFTATARAFTLYVVPRGASPALSYAVAYQQNVNAGESFRCLSALGHVVPSGGFIYGQASFDGALAITISGREIPA